ncbi:sulfatase-like hydrolase/transferase [Armatimonas sp.]|uniref:sulfatase family protein n=1 Tax=Armatimonas sp. TaxID=1872638 RepID=UPI00286AF5EC|nr:sulfatase-like hydrolase/transferase [Armatimonas sp.]
MRFSFLACLAAFCLAVPTGAQPQKPNIVVIFTDDHGFADLGVQGSVKDIQTPNIDALARDGVRFTRGYVTAPQCVPSRAGLLTGRYQQRFGVDDNLKGPLPLSEQTLAERLKDAGYTTGMAGKWHLDLTPAPGGGQRSSGQFMPHAQGFTEYWRGEMTNYVASHALDGTPFSDAPKTVNDKRFRITVQTEAALGFLERRGKETTKKPFFLYLAYYGPHVPLESPEPWFSKTPKEVPLERRQALATLAAIDEGVGKVREKLKALGQEKNTLIFFVSDNGAPLRKGAWDGSLNTPLVGEKGMLTDGGIRVPFVAAWPGTLPKNTVYEKAVSTLDVAATATALAGQKPDAALDGVNLMPYLTGKNKSEPHPNLYWRWRTQAAVLEGNWKLVRLGSESFLYDTTKPEGEKLNLAAKEPARVAALSAKLEAWSKMMRDPNLPSAAINPADQKFFDDHVLGAGAGKASVAGVAGGTQGWIARYSELALKDGALVLTPDALAKQAPFAVKQGLSLTGPLTLKFSLKGDPKGEGAISWRLDGQQSFAQTKFVLGKECTAELPETGKIVHLRLLLPKETPTAIESIELLGKNGKRVGFWDFRGAPAVHVER